MQDAKQKVIIASSSEAFRLKLQEHLDDGWEIVPGSVSVGVAWTGATVAERCVAVIINPEYQTF